MKNRSGWRGRVCAVGVLVCLGSLRCTVDDGKENTYGYGGGGSGGANSGTGGTLGQGGARPTGGVGARNSGGAGGMGVAGMAAGGSGVSGSAAGGATTSGGTDGETTGGTGTGGDDMDPEGGTGTGGGGVVDPPDGVCSPGAKRSCSESGLLGPCAKGVETCGDDGKWGSCSIAPATTDTCQRGDDSNCDGNANGNSECGCIEGAKRACSAGGALGNCAKGEQTCLATGAFGPCSIMPGAKDRCDTEGDDTDCNGTPNTACPCVNGRTQPCGPAAVGICKRGTSTCVNAAWGACEGAVVAKARDCSSALDNNCDGSPDDTVDTVCECKSGTTRECNTHPGKDGKGPCKAGSQTCVLATSKATSSYGACTGAVGPTTADTCAANDDSNCNGVKNEGCDCVAGAKSTCGTEYSSKGVCAAISLTCSAQGKWPAATGCAATAMETCAADMKDEDCDGSVNENCQCSIGATRTCAQGGLSGPCASGTQTCGSAGTWGSCSIAPGTDTCVSGNDASCNGEPNEGCACINNSTRSCGACNDGTQTCTNGKTGTYSACTKPNQPVYYRDSDGDGYGDAKSSKGSCTGAPTGYVANAEDCCDSDKRANPAQTKAESSPNNCGDYDYDCDDKLTRDFGSEEMNGCNCFPWCGQDGTQCMGCGCPDRCQSGECGGITGGVWVTGDSCTQTNWHVTISCR